MIATAFSLMRSFCILVVCVCCFVFLTQAQQEQTTSEKADDVIRINSDLAQTDVMVFDKQGRFVENLKPEQFELKIDGKPKPITFFEYLKAGSSNEDAQLAAARGDVRKPASGQIPGTVVPLDRGRIVIFFVDDLHLAADSIKRVRDLLLRFIDRDFGQNDEAAIVSPSGQIGFLQQITDDRSVLRAAVARLRPRPVLDRDHGHPAMSQQQALDIENSNQELLDYFVDRFLADNPGFPRESVVQIIHARAQGLLQQATGVTSNTLSTLDSLIRSSAQMPGRKLVFFISEGFLIDDRTSSVTSDLRRITDSAARGGVVIYSIDARGLTSGSADATTEITVDISHRLERESRNEVITTQLPLRSLANDTGGRALLNTNALSAAAETALKETEIYYLLAWHADDEQKENRFRRIEVNIVGRPDLIVRARRGFIEQTTKANAPIGSGAAQPTDVKSSAEEHLLRALRSRRPLTSLPTSVNVSYADAPSVGAYITATMEVDGESLLANPTTPRSSTTVDIGGIVFDDQGKSISSFQKQIGVNLVALRDSKARKRGVVFSYQAKLKPGLYLVRVASRDRSDGRSGSASQWIEIPDLSSRRIYLSSVVVGEHLINISGTTSDSNKESDDVFFSVSRRFPRNSRLRFATHIYNATLSTDGTSTPDVALQVQILRDNQPVLTTALGKVDTKGVEDLARLPYAAEIPLQSIPAGRYVLQVTVIDRIAKTSATQHVSFEVG